MTRRRGGVLILMPAFNEVRTIGGVLECVRHHAPDCDVIVVNDGSRDGTREAVEAAGAAQIVLPCNLGYGPALQAGFRYAEMAGYTTVVLLDADGQHDPADIPRVLEAMDRSGADVVIGSRFVNGGWYSGPLPRRLGMQFFSLLTKLLIGQRIYDTTSGFKALRAVAYRPLISGHFLDFHAECLVFWGKLGLRIAEVPIATRPRSDGRSMYSWFTLMNYPFKTLMLMILGLMDARGRRPVR